MADINNQYINTCDKDGRTPLMNAIIENQIDKARTLLNAGANVNTKDKNGNTALVYAAIKSLTEFTEELIQHGADVNAADNSGNTALMKIALLSGLGLYHGNIKIVKILIENGANTAIKKVRGRKAINTPKKSDIRNLIRNANPDPVKVILNYVKNKHNQRG